MAEKLYRWDPSEHIETDEDAAYFLEAAVEEDPDMLPAAIGVVARSIGMTEVARRTGISREALYTALSEVGNPNYKTIRKVLDACGVKISITPAAGAKATRKAPAKRPAGKAPAAKREAIPA